MSDKARVLIYVLRRDLRLADNPIFSEVSRLFNQSQHRFTHLLPIYIFSADQIEVSGFVSSPNKRSPYPEARSEVAGFWRCGQLRARFLAESVWDLKQDLEKVGSGLVIRVGSVQDAIRSVLQGYQDRKDEVDVQAVWMTEEDAVEEKREARAVQDLCRQHDAECKIFTDEKYFADDRDLPFDKPSGLSDVFTSFRKTVEPLREAPRKVRAAPTTLPPLPSYIPAQFEPFEIPTSLDDIVAALSSPLSPNLQLPDAPEMPSNAKSAHPFKGGAGAGLDRVKHLITNGSMSAYKDTRNGLLGLDFSTKLSAWLALGCITARQVHWYLFDFEDGRTPLGRESPGYGKGENKGTAAVRFELLWRDYMRLCTRKFGHRLFKVSGYRDDTSSQWKYVSPSHGTKGRSSSSTSTDQHRYPRAGGSNDADTAAAVQRFLIGKTGTGLIDASQRELFLTGYTSNRARQNVASYLAKHLGIDWRIGAEWYETNLIDYDVSSNWGNWQYVAGVGNDPRGEQRVFNPVKQAMDYDGKGDYVRAWVPELRDVGHSPEDLMGLFQAWRLSEEDKSRLGLSGVEWVEKPLVRINFSLNRRGGGTPNRGRGGGGGGGGRGRGGRKGRGGRNDRTGPMEKAGFTG